MANGDALDMSQYRIDRLPKRERSTAEVWMARAGIPLAAAAFILFGFIWTPEFLVALNTESLPDQALAVLEEVGREEMTRRNSAMLGIFLVGMILWTTQSIPNYLTSLIVIISLVLTGVLSEREAYAQLGHPIMWLNIMSFILASMLVKTGLAKRFTLWFILKFGTSASKVFLSFIFINVVLSAFISATTAKAAIMLPIFMVIAAIYGARSGSGKTNFGRNIVLQQLLNINLGAGAFVTGSGANLLAAALITGAISGGVFFADWMVAMLPTMLGLMLIGYILGMRMVFPLEAREKLPQISGGMQRLQEEYDALGPVRWDEIRSSIIFLTILAFWATDRLHGISATAVAFVGGIVALMPRVGIVEWNDVDIPWHLMLFSAGAYCLGAGFAQTGLPNLGVDAFFTGIGLDQDTPFWVLYLILTAVMAYSALVSQSKTMRTMIFVPIAIGTAEHFGQPVISLALPVAFLIEHVYVLPFNSKPAALLYETDMYSLTDAIKYGMIMITLGWLAVIVMGETWFRFLGITPNGVFGVF
ncbi:MAG: DASS family sodium-coupled anion symporter [Gammaproteobacteria bacterium]|nr:DASS family sodium-coupled anion symporter [Gammaproteobacteria bacterium]